MPSCLPLTIGTVWHPEFRLHSCLAVCRAASFRAWCGEEQSISVLLEVPVFHHANVRTMYVETKKTCKKKRKKKLFEWKNWKIYRKETVGKMYFDKQPVVPFDVFVCMHACATGLEISFIIGGVCVWRGGRYVQHLWRFLKLCASVRACVCISLFDWHQFLSGCVCTLWSKLPRFRPPISSSCEAPESSEVGHSISLKVNWTAGCVQPACSQAQYYTIHPQATTRSPETATFLLNLSSPVYLLHPKLC